MSALRDAIIKVCATMPVIEFAQGDDWIQVDPVEDRWRWRHHKSIDWNGWASGFFNDEGAALDESTIRIVPRAEADDWRSRPAFPCHQLTTQELETMRNRWIGVLPISEDAEQLAYVIEWDPAARCYTASGGGVISAGTTPEKAIAAHRSAVAMAVRNAPPRRAAHSEPAPVSTEQLTPMDIRAADANGRLVVDGNGYGTVYPTQIATETATNPHPSGCHTETPGLRNCDSDGHESCGTCSRRAERDDMVQEAMATIWRNGGIVISPDLDQCSCDFCTGKKKIEDNWCPRCGEEMLQLPKRWENLNVCDKCETDMRISDHLDTIQKLIDDCEDNELSRAAFDALTAIKNEITRDGSIKNQLPTISVPEPQSNIPAHTNHDKSAAFDHDPGDEE